MNKNCINCLCHFCDRSECRYKASAKRICDIRCIEVGTAVNVHYKPVMCCDRFHHVGLHKVYRVKLKAHTIDDALKRMSAADFLKVLGGGKRD